MEELARERWVGRGEAERQREQDGQRTQGGQLVPVYHSRVRVVERRGEGGAGDTSTGHQMMET